MSTCQGFDPTQDLPELEVSACVEQVHADYQVIIAHNRSAFRPWLFPVPKDVAEFITLAVTGYPGAMAQVEALRAQLERAEGMIVSLQQENSELAAELKIANQERP